MAKAKKAIKKKALSQKKVVVKKKVVAKKKSVTKKKNVPVPEPVKKKETNPITRGMEMPGEMAGTTAPATSVPAVIIDIPPDELVIELCGPGKRCKQKFDGNFIRQNFISGRWVQVGGTVFPTLEACKRACGG